MNRSDRFIQQIEKTIQRSKETILIDPPAINNEVSIVEADVLVLNGAAIINDNVSHNHDVVGEIETRNLANKIRKTVNPGQITKFIKTNNINLTRFIDDSSFRERIINGDDSLDACYTGKGAHANKSVCRITIVTIGGEEEGYGTGFLIAPNILITNNHVLPHVDYGTNSYAEFNFEKGLDDLPLASRFFRLEPGKLFHTNLELDYTIVSVSENSTDQKQKLSEYGFLKLNSQLGKTKEGNCVSIIQHPDGKMKKVALRENKITNLSFPKVIRYVTDTKSGSSGSPVFNDNWEVVGLHHSGVPKINSAGAILNTAGSVWDKSQGEAAIAWAENEGIRVSSIIYDITTNASVTYPFLLQHFSKVTDIETVKVSMGDKELEAVTYYPKEADERDKHVYYSPINDIAQVAFADLNALLTKTHTNHKDYSPSKLVYPKVDLHPDLQLRSIYSNKKFDAQEFILADEKVDIERKLKLFETSKLKVGLEGTKYTELVDQVESALPYNCEHVVCQSWFKKQEPMRGDLHHLFACESRCNSFRNNHPYYDFINYQPEPLDDKEVERPTCGNMEQNLFEPENNKGVVARAVLYFLVRYPGQIDVYDHHSLDMLKDWANNELPTVYELHRNREIFLLQGNRNPFIDFPELVNTFDFTDAFL